MNATKHHMQMMRFKERMAAGSSVCAVMFALLVSISASASAQYVDWVLHIGGSGDDFSSNRIGVDYDGNAIVSGYFSGTIQLGTETLTSQSSDNVDAFVAKITPNGRVAWKMLISGTGTEAIYSTRMAFDRNNNIYLAFLSTSNIVSIGGREVRLDGPSPDRPRVVKLDANGNYQWCVTDSEVLAWGQGATDWCQLVVDGQGNLLMSSKGWVRDAELRKYSPEGNLIFKTRYPFSQVAYDAGIPNIRSIATDAEGNVFTASRYSRSQQLLDSTYTGGRDEILLIKQGPEGDFRWARKITGDSTREDVHYSNVENGVWTVYGSNNSFGAVSTVPIDFGGKTIDMRRSLNAFRARYDLNGNLLSVDQPSFSFGYYVSGAADVEIQERGNTTVIASPAAGVVDVKGDNFSQSFAGTTYALKDACGGHYYCAEFKDTVSIQNDRFRLVSRGGKDIYLAFLKPGVKYIPVRPGSRFPLDNSVDLDIPVRTEWWPVSCANGYRFQLSRDSGMTSVVLDTVMPLDPFLNLDRLEPLTKYYWRLRANTSDTFGVWSDTRSFTTVKAQPADVVLEYPANDSKGVTRGVTLRWQASKRAATYLVDIATDSAFSEKVVNGRLITTNTFDVLLEARRTYFWRVRAGNAAGTSPWSNVWKFDVKPDKPAKIVLDQPVNGAQGEPRNTLLGWKSLDDATQYIVQVARDSSMAFVEVEKTVSDAFWRGDFEGNTTYFWRVRGSNGIELGDWSTVWSFATSNTTGVTEDNSERDLTATYIDGAILVHINNEKLLNQEVKIALYELTGREVMSARTRVDGSPLRIAVPKLVAGTYLLEIREQSGEVHRIKVALD